MIHSDFHIHSENSYDAKNTLEEIAQGAIKQGLRMVGITDHANYNDKSFIGDLHNSAKAVKEIQEKYPFMVLGVELTPIEMPEFEYLQRTGVREGYQPPESSEPYAIELAQTKEELIELGVRYAVGASHWRVDVPNGKSKIWDLDACIKEWYRQQMWLACDERVTILGHPWCIGNGLWYKDFSVIPHSMNVDIASVLRENGKYFECNSHFFCTDMTTERFKNQYAEFLRELFEMGLPMTYGSDSHVGYDDKRQTVESYLEKVGFKDGDISELSEKDLW